MNLNGILIAREIGMGALAFRNVDFIDAYLGVKLGNAPVNLLNANQQNMTKWTKNGNFTITYENNVNDVKLVTDSSAEYLHLYSVKVENGKQYRFQFKGCTPSGLSYISGQNKQQIEIYTTKVIAETYWDGSASETMQKYTIDFTASTNSINILFPFGKLDNNKTFTFKIKDLALYEVK